MRRAGWINRLTLALIARLLLPDTSMAMADEPIVGKLVSLQGQVAVRHSSDTRWESAKIGQSLGPATRCAPAPPPPPPSSVWTKPRSSSMKTPSSSSKASPLRPGCSR